MKLLNTEPNLHIANEKPNENANSLPMNQSTHNAVVPRLSDAPPNPNINLPKYIIFQLCAPNPIVNIN